MALLQLASCFLPKLPSELEPRMGAPGLLLTVATPAQWQGRPTARPNAVWLPKATSMGLRAEVAAAQEGSGSQTPVVWKPPRELASGTAQG